MTSRATRRATLAVALLAGCASTDEHLVTLEQRVASLESQWASRVENLRASAAKAEERERFDADATRADPFSRTTPGEARISLDRLRRVIAEAERTRSNSLVVVHDGRLLVDRTFGHAPGPVQLRSVTKSFTGVAIGMLLADGKIASLELPISTWFPEWSNGLRAKVTLRHLLEHTSGIEHQFGDKLLAAEQDSVAYVRSHAVTTEPGSIYSYNNDAMQLLGAIVVQVSGEKLDDYLRARLFEPLGFGDSSWDRDPSGNVYCHAALALDRIDLAKFGQLLLMNGAWQGRTLIPPGWIADSTKPTSSSGSSYGSLWQMYRRVDPATQRHVLAGFGHGGSYGQYLVVLPAQKIVIVRQAAREGPDFDVQAVINALSP